MKEKKIFDLDGKDDMSLSKTVVKPKGGKKKLVLKEKERQEAFVVEKKRGMHSGPG